MKANQYILIVLVVSFQLTEVSSISLTMSILVIFIGGTLLYSYCPDQEHSFDLSFILMSDDLRLYQYFALFKIGKSSLRPSSTATSDIIIIIISGVAVLQRLGNPVYSYCVCFESFHLK